MAIIPPDAAIRLRMQAEASLSPVAGLKPLAPMSADMPELKQGQTFTARIQQALPENTYRALVAGKEITLSLPEAAKSGDTLELVVVERGPRMVMAQLVDASPTRTAAAASAVLDEDASLSNTTQLSPAGRMIGKLLLPAGESPEPVLLNQGIPLLKPPLPSAGNLAAILAPRLEQAATQSGLFYESHQAQWLSGQHTTEALLEEPQARHAPIPAPNTQPTEAEKVVTLPRAAVVESANDKASPQMLAINTPDSANNTTAVKDLMQSIPAELRPLVQQQLDAAATQRLAWQGEVWPGQTMQWQISRDAPERKTNVAMQDELPQWNTSLALTTPVLGRVEAALTIAGNTVRIRLAADSPVSVSKLNGSLTRLQSALEAAGLQPAGIQVRNGNH